MKLQHILLASFFIFALSITACQNEAATAEGGEQQQQQPKETVDLTALNGEWAITEAKMGGKVRNSLQDGSFTFLEGNKLSIGIAGFPGITKDEPLEYQLEDKTIKVKSADEINFTITTLDAKNMALESKVQGFDLVFTLEKQ